MAGDPGTGELWSAGWSTLWDGLANPASTETATGGDALEGVLVEIDKDGDGVADQTVRTDEDGKFQRYLTGAERWDPHDPGASRRDRC